MNKNNIIDRIFPVKYKFYEMLYKQANTNGLGVNALYNWVKSGTVADSEALIHCVKEADEVRMNMEKDLIEAFSTPFDRGDIYSISVGMNEVLKYAQSSLLSMEAFEVKPDFIIIGMVEQLKIGVDVFSQAVKDLEKDPDKSAQVVVKMRVTHIEIERLYRDGMISVFASGDPMFALKQREVYHHIKDASTNLDETVDVLHRIIVRLI
ncbi:DUF47 domain-containing protein [Acetobacterium tundrae]|uniref:DUF47 domain-containing protein n=1 Tax=Acetobacterium tundrae TaxID=132932 RepID=A0ABR6WKK2_9FIRM|nr:DUF47 domain-containing protein [Acetobacterium tundrae]MBC3796979.1 DUF47 domain-containing protein [Acetobacterium tundrae]